ncbi:hypothetical protein [Sporosalibacterium faouarense]|uniref:hypothetical protein n=1 Tax=Sporosalibacterium faouarense TaxID=516123 RepID=UPI00192AF021|nr:hypothetical protein [Sporosalibacterium faouarense]
MSSESNQKNNQGLNALKYFVKTIGFIAICILMFGVGIFVGFQLFKRFFYL